MELNPELPTPTNDDENKAVPPLYICTHRDAPHLCALWDQHPRNPTHYAGVTRNTPCRFCGHTGTLRKVN